MTEPAPEFSHIVNADRLPAAGIEQALEAKPDERAALAKRFDLVELASLTALLHVKQERGGNVIVRGKLTADIVQSCVVTLEPIAAHFDLPVDIIFVPASLQVAGAGGPNADEENQELDYYSDGKIDLGELIAQQLGITIDPYPRKPDAALPRTEFGAERPETHPFAHLPALARKTKNKDKTDK